MVIPNIQPEESCASNVCGVHDFQFRVMSYRDLKLRSWYFLTIKLFLSSKPCMLGYLFIFEFGAVKGNTGYDFVIFNKNG